MYLYFDNGGTLRTLIPHGEIPRQGNPLNLYLCFDEDRFDEESRQNFIIKIRFTFPDGTLSNEYTINPLQTDSNNNGYYLGLQQFEKLSDSEITFALKPGMEYHMFKYGFTGADRITTLYGKVLIHISFVYKEYDEEGNVVGENVYEENGTFHIERTIGSNLKQSVITPDEYTELQNLINRYILEFNDITFITDVESLESVELPDIRHLYRVRNAEGKLEYYNYRYEEWHRFVTGDEFADLVAKNDDHEQRISVLEPKVKDLEDKTKDHDESIEELRNKQTDLQDQIYEEVDDREKEVRRLDGRIDQHETVVEDLSQDVDNRFATVNETLNKKINRDFSGLGVASTVHKEDTVIVRCAGCNGGPASTYTLTVGALTALINSEVDYFKGYHASLAALQASHPNGEPGDYAFVATENDDQYHMYVWDEEQKPGRWEETISGQYLLASSFETFQQGLINGSIHVGAVKGNVNDTEETDPLLVNIEINGEKYILPSVALDFLGEPVKDAYKLGAIKINGDTWNVNNDIVTLEMSDENIDGAYELGSININGNKWNVLKLSTVNAKIAELKAYLDANNFNKGEFLSLEKLQEKHPEGNPGEFAFVNTPTDQGDVMLMYVWDEDANTWKETTSNQYVLTSVFENFKEEINEEINDLWDDVDALWEKGGGGVKSLFNVIRYDELTSEQIYEVPVLYKGNIPISPKKTQNIKGFYINKQLDNGTITMLISYMLLTNNLINSVEPFLNGTFNDDDFSVNDWLYFAEAYDEENDCYYDLYAHYEINVDNQNINLTLGCTGANGISLDIWNSEDGWYSDAPDYVEMGFDLYTNSNELGLELMSNIFSVDPFETYEFDLYYVDSSYYNMSSGETPNWDGTWYRPWNKINGGSATSSSASAFVDVKSLETKIESNVIPQTGFVGNLYFNTSLSNEEVIDIVSKLEVGESMPLYYILVAKEMECMLYVGLESQPTSELGEISSGSDYYIAERWGDNTCIIWHSAQGWDPNGDCGPDLENGYGYGVNLMTPEELVSVGFPADGHCGDQNDLLVSIVSTEKGNFEYTEPKEVAVGDKDKVYRMVDSKGEYSYHQIKNDEWEYFGGNIIPVNNLSDAEKLVGTPITKYENAGPVTVYINKTLTNEQVQELCSKVYYDNTGRYFVSGNFFCMGFVMIANASLQPTSIQGDVQDNYQIFAYDKNTDEEIEIWSTSEGWSSNCPDSVIIDTNLPMETSVEPLSEEDAEEFIGKYNDIIKDLLSATPFKIGVDKKAIYRVKEEKEPKVVKSALPAGDSGATFDKFYLNMNLSPEEMLKIFQSVEYRALSYDYKNHYIIHTLKHPDPNNNNSLMFKYTLQIIQLSDTQYNLVLSEWVYNSSDTKYILCSYDNGVVEWASDISNFVNSDGSLKTEWVGNKFWDEEYSGELGYSIGSENHKLIDLIYLQSTEEVYDYTYYQYTSNGWERYGSSIVSVKELPSDNIDKKAIYRVAKEIPQEPIIVKNAVPSKPAEPEKIYIDRSLSIEQVVEILSKLNYSVSSANGYSSGHNIIYVGFNNSTNIYTMLYAHNPFNSGQYSINLCIGDFPGGRNAGYITIFDDVNGWYSDTEEFLNEDGSIKEEFTGEFATQYYDGSDGIWDYSPVASQNDLVKDLIYVQRIEQPEPDFDYTYYQYKKGEWSEFGAGGSSNAEPLTFELSSERQEGANELGSIRIGEDVWNMPQGGGSGSTPKKYEFSGVPVYMGDDLIPHLCGIEITGTEILNELQKVINNEKIVQVYYGGGYDVSKSSYLFTSAINFFTMDIITTGGLPSSGHGVAIIYANNKCYYCDTDFWNSDASAAITKTINLTFKFFELGNSSGGGNTSNSEGSSETLKYKTLYSFESVSGDTFTFPTNLVFEKDVVYAAIVEGFVFNLYYDAYDTINADGNVNVGGETYSIHLYHSGGNNTFSLTGRALSDNSEFPYTEHIGQFDICQIVGGSSGGSGGVSGITKNTYEVDPSNISIDLTTYVGGVKFVVNNDNGLSDFMFNNRDNMMKVKITTQVSISDLDAVINYEFNFSKTSSEVMFATVSGALQIGSVQLHFGGTGTIPLTASDGIGLGEIGDYFYNAEVSEHFFRFDRVNVYLGEQDGMTFSLIGFTIEAYSL